MSEAQAVKATHFGILGAGAWGTALAMTAVRSGNRATLWSRNENVISSITQDRVNSVYLPGQFLDPAIEITDQLTDLSQCDALIIATASQSVRALCISISDLISSDVPIILACKGMERGSLMLMPEVVESILPQNPVVMLSGPNFASEVAMGKPCATVIASKQKNVAERIAFTLGGQYFRPYISDDIAGVAMCGAVKNVIAIAAGITIGRGLGENARASLITRGLIEMKKLVKVKHGREETVMGLAGIGDLMLTCGSLQSRNFSLGYQIGKSAAEAETQDNAEITRGLTEGSNTAETMMHFAEKQGVSLPICHMVAQIMDKTLTVDQAIKQLISRPFIEE